MFRGLCRALCGIFVLFFVVSPVGPARHLDVLGQKLSPHCLATISDLQFPLPQLSTKMPPKLFLAHKKPCWGWGFAQIWRRFLFVFSFRLSFFKETESSHRSVARFWCADFGALISAQIFAQIFFAAQISAEIFGVQCADFSADFCADFPAEFSSGFWRNKSVPEPRKNVHKICGKICGVPIACPGRGP